jgi:signal transduction histidine kinase
MKRRVAGAIIAIVIFTSVCAVASEKFGTRDEARALLERAVSHLQSNQDKALEDFTTGDEGFIDRDLYVFCGGPDGMITTHPDVFGLSLLDFKDKAGKAVGEEMYETAREGEISEISYKWPRPAQGDVPVDKVTFYTKVEDQICGVGYYSR